MNLNIREMIDGHPVRLRYVHRYSTSRVSVPESVAEHSFFVALYCMFIGEWVIQMHPTDDERWEPAQFMAELLQRALVHDLEEARSGDFPRSFKHSSEPLKAMLEHASQEAFAQVIEGVLDNHVIKARYIAMWHNSKDSSFAGRVLEFADFLGVLSFMLQEGCANGHQVIMRHVADMRTYFDKFGEEDYDFIRPLVEQAGVIIRKLFSAAPGDFIHG